MATSVQSKEENNVAVLRAFLTAGDLQGGVDFVKQLIQPYRSSTAPASVLNVFLFNLLVRELARVGDFAAAEYWIAEICNVGLAPNTHTFMAVINTCAEEGNLDKMQHYVTMMESFGLEQNEFTYNAIIKAHAIRGDLAAAQQEVTKMREQGVDMSNCTYNLLIHTCTKAGYLKLAGEYLLQMEELGIMPNAITYNSVINACATEGDMESAERWFTRMLRNGVQPNQITYGTICKAFARNGKAGKVEELMRHCEATGNKLNEYFYASLLCACGQSRPPNRPRAEQAVQEMMQRGIPLDSVSKHLYRLLGVRRVEQLKRGAKPRQTLVVAEPWDRDTPASQLDFRRRLRRYPRKTLDQAEWSPNSAPVPAQRMNITADRLASHCHRQEDCRMEMANPWSCLYEQQNIQELPIEAAAWQPQYVQIGSGSGSSTPPTPSTYCDFGNCSSASDVLPAAPHEDSLNALTLKPSFRRVSVAQLCAAVQRREDWQSYRGETTRCSA